MTTPTTITGTIRRAMANGTKGWAVTWGQRRRRFRQTIWFPTRGQADQFATGLRAGDEGGDVERLLLKAWGRPRTVAAIERGRLGGPARAAALSPERRREIAKKAADAASLARTRAAQERLAAKQIDADAPQIDGGQ